MYNTTLLGPHFLDAPTPTQVTALVKWNPPVCLVLLADLFDTSNSPSRQLQHELGMPEDQGYTPKNIAETAMTDSEFSSWIGGIAGRVSRSAIRNELTELFKEEAQLRHTKIIGRIYIPDATVETHLNQHPERTAKLHNAVVYAVREALYPSTSTEKDMSNFVDYWVVANEVKRKDVMIAGKEVPEPYEDYVDRLSRYETKRMQLANDAEVNGTTSSLGAYGCGLFAFASEHPLLPPPRNRREEIGREKEFDDAGIHEDKLHFWKLQAPKGSTTKRIFDVLQEANRTGQHVLLLHQYFKPDMFAGGKTSTNDGDLWTKDHNLTPHNLSKNVRRFEHHVYSWFRDEFPNLKVIVSEYGADGRLWRMGIPGTEDRGWRHKDSSWLTDDENGHPRYLRVLRDLERENLDQSNVILGYCLFGLGSHSEFENYRIDDPNDTVGPNGILGALQDGVGEMLQREEEVDPTNKFHLSYGFKTQDDGRVSGWIESKHAPVHHFATHHPGWQIFLLEEQFRPATEVTISISGARRVTNTGRDISGTSNVAIEIKVNKEGKGWFAKPANANWDDVGHVAFEKMGNFSWEGPAQVAAVQSKLTVYSQPAATATVSHTLRRQSTHVRFPVVGMNKPTFATAQWLQIRYTPPAVSTGSAARGGVIGASGETRQSSLRSTGPRNGWVTKESVHVYGSTSTIPRTWGAALGTVSLRLATGVTLGLNLRSGPSTSYTVLRTLPYNRNLWYAITGKDGNPTTWWQIRTDDGTQGWVHGNYVETSGDVATVPEVVATPAPAPTPMSNPDPDPSAVSSEGVYLNLAVNHDGAWKVKKSGTKVTATCSSSRSPVQYFARQRPEDLWTVPAGFRPTQIVTATVTGARHVNSNGSDHASTATHSFDLQVAKDGAVRYVDNGKVDHVGFLRYNATFSWETAAAAVAPAPVVMPTSRPTLSLPTGTTSGLNVRTGPGTSHDRLATISGGSTTAYPIVGRHGTPTWWQIEYSSSITGWVHGNYVKTKGSVDNVPATWVENTYLNQTLHQGSHFELERIGDTVTGHFITSRSPVQYSARQNPEDLFTVPDGFRPSSAYTVTVTGARHVNSDGSDHTNTATHSFDLTVSTNGTVRYVNNSKVNHVGYLRYQVDVSWTAAARSTVPGAPTDFEVDDRDHESLNLDWQAPDEDGGSPITGYRIERWQNGSWQSLVADTGSSRTSHDLTGLTAATSYTLRVRALNKVGAGIPSSSLQVQTHAALPAKPGAPRNVGGRATHDTVTLTWDAPNRDTVTGYRIRRQLHPSRTWTLLVEDTGETLTRWVDTNQVAMSSTYRYEVRARNGSTVGDAGIGSLTTRAQPTTAGAPTALRVAPGDRSQVTLTWTAPRSDGGADLTGYRIERAEDATSLVWQTVEADTADTATTWSETGLTASTTYHYRVAARNAAGVGAVSASARAITRPQLALKSDGTYPLSAYSEPDSAATVTATFPRYESWRRLDLLAQVPDPNGWWRGLVYGPNVNGPFWLRRDQVTTHGATRNVPAVPAAPANLGTKASRRSGTGSWRITLTWDNPRDASITGYQLWRRAGTAAAILHEADMGNVLTWTDTTDLSPGTTYTYQVRALNAHGGGPRSRASAAALPAATPQLSLKATTTANLNVRSGPGTGHGKVGFITGGSTARYDILGKDAATPTWYQIRFSSTVHRLGPRQLRADPRGPLRAHRDLEFNPAAEPQGHHHDQPQRALRTRHSPRQDRLHRRRLHHPLQHPGQGCRHPHLVPNPV